MQQIAQSLRNRFFARPNCESIHLCLMIWFQSCETSDLLLLRVHDSGGHEIVGIRINVVQNLHAETDQFGSNRFQVHRVSSLEDFLSLLSRAERGR
jgi:hypothetical protein